MSDFEPKEKAYVAFQGGGALGVAHFGAWQAISENFEIVGVAGTSSGSIVAALCAAGFSAEEAFERFQIGLHEFVEHKNPTCSALNIALRMLLGLDSSSDGHRFQNWLEDQLEDSPLGKRKVKFREFKDESKPYIEIIACDLNNPNEPVKFSPYKSDWNTLSDAVRASISLPGFFGIQRLGNRALIDGGFICNFPMESIYKRAAQEDCALIGVRFKKEKRSSNWFNLRHVFSRSYEVLMANSSQVSEQIRSYSKHAIIEIDDLGFNPLDFNLSQKKTCCLKSVGEDAAREQLTKLQDRLDHIKLQLLAQLSPGERAAVIQAQQWFTNTAIPEREKYYTDILNSNQLHSLRLTDRDKDDFDWEIRKYLMRISESLIDLKSLNIVAEESSLPSLETIGISIKNHKTISPSIRSQKIYDVVFDSIQRRYS